MLLFRHSSNTDGSTVELKCCIAEIEADAGNASVLESTRRRTIGCIYSSLAPAGTLCSLTHLASSPMLPSAPPASALPHKALNTAHLSLSRSNSHTKIISRQRNTRFTSAIRGVSFTPKVVKVLQQSPPKFAKIRQNAHSGGNHQGEEDLHSTR